MRNNSGRIVNFFVRSAPLVIAGVALGLIARSFFGVPEESNTIERQFKNPVPETIEAPHHLFEEKNFPVSDVDL